MVRNFCERSMVTSTDGSGAQWHSDLKPLLREIMLTLLGNLWDTVDLLSGFLLIICVETIQIHGQKGDGCGHTVMGPQSGTLASRNFPGTYPNGTHCEWRLRVPERRMLQLAFGDFDLELTPGCKQGSLTIIPGDGAPSLGPLCGHLNTTWRRLTINSSEVTVLFVTGTHRSGRGFLLSYATDQQTDLISCMERGTYYTSQQFRAFCPAGCRDVMGDIWGQSEQGYRDTSVLCKAAVHAGVVSDALGGSIDVSREKSITLYESSFANGLLSKTGIFWYSFCALSTDCHTPLNISSFNASSIWEEVDNLGRQVLWFPGKRDSRGHGLPWVASRSDIKPWLEVQLQGKSNITGIITKGSSSGSTSFYVKAYVLLYSKDRKNWRAYKAANSKEKKVFEGNSDSSQEVLNSLIPPVVAQYLLLRPQEWHNQPATHIRVLGCRVIQLRTAIIPKIVTPTTTTHKIPVLEVPKINDMEQNFSQTVVVALAVALLLALCVCLLLVGLQWKKRYSCNSLQEKNSALSEELIPYPLERSINDPLPPPPLNDYAEPDLLVTGPKLGSTFRPPADDGYTTPLIVNHYDVPGKVHEYAEPLPPEPEYATPFSDQPPDSLVLHPPPERNLRLVHVIPPVQTGWTSQGDTLPPAQYDCPSHRMAPNGYLTPFSETISMKKESVLYSEQQSANSLPQHTYNLPL
ncbi:discoidin, CUB and LCCL domain-containing protein 1-like isoform X1 [Arapaima gigas]